MTDGSNQATLSGAVGLSDDKVLERLHRAYVCEDNPLMSCPACGDVARQQSYLADGKIKRELRCTNCGHTERQVVVNTTEPRPRINELPFEANLSHSRATAEELVPFLLWYDRWQEVAECR